VSDLDEALLVDATGAIFLDVAGEQECQSVPRCVKVD